MMLQGYSFYRNKADNHAYLVTFYRIFRKHVRT